MILRPAVFVGILLLSSVAARSDSYGPFCNFRQVDPTGRFYVVVKKLPGNPDDPGRGTSVAFTIAERPGGAPPVLDAEDTPSEEDFELVVPNPEVAVRDGDIRHGSGRLKRCPRQILISSTGLGFVGVDVQGYNFGDLQSDNSLVVVNLHGKVIHRKKLIDLFTEEGLSELCGTAGGVFWSGGGWVDEQRHCAVIISVERGGIDRKAVGPRHVRVVDLKSGRITRGSDAEIVRAVSERIPGGLDFAIDLVAERGLENARGFVEKLLDDLSAPLQTRLRSAVALAAFADHRGIELVSKAAVTSGPTQGYAVGNLTMFLGDRAAPVICEAVRVSGREVHHEAWQAMRVLKAPAAVPPLIDLVKVRNQPDGVRFAAEMLQHYRSEARDAVPHLIRIVETDLKMAHPEWIKAEAVSALACIGEDALEALPALKRLAASTQARRKALESRQTSPTAVDPELASVRRLDEKLFEALSVIPPRNQR